MDHGRAVPSPPGGPAQPLTRGEGAGQANGSLSYAKLVFRSILTVDSRESHRRLVPTRRQKGDDRNTPETGIKEVR
jgi:hypothetical protein